MEDNNNCWLYTNCNHKDCSTADEPNKFCLRYYKLDALFKASLLEDTQRYRISLRVDEDGTDFEEFKKLSEIDKNIVQFVSSGKNLYIYSHICGNGKSSFAIRCIQDYFNAIWPATDLTCRALFVSVPRFLVALKDSISNKNDYANYIKENIINADLVVFDDIGSRVVGSDYDREQLLSIIDARIALGKANIYTSNLNEAEMEQNLGPRIASRVCSLSYCIELKGKDKRSILGGTK